MFTQINKIAIAFALIAGLLVTANPAYSQVEVDSTALTGQVVDSETEQPVSDIELKIKGTEKTATSNEKGEFTFADLEPGKYTIVASPEGYEEVSQEVEFVAEETEPDEKLVIKLTPSTSDS